jgi:hypothetical protein
VRVHATLSKFIYISILFELHLTKRHEEKLVWCLWVSSALGDKGLAQFGRHSQQWLSFLHTWEHSEGEMDECRKDWVFTLLMLEI